jgi:hypothetical protein
MNGVMFRRFSRRAILPWPESPGVSLRINGDRPWWMKISLQRAAWRPNPMNETSEERCDVAIPTFERPGRELPRRYASRNDNEQW